MRARGWVRVACIAAVALLLGCDGGSPRSDDVTNVVLVSIDCLNLRQLREGIAAGDAPVLAKLEAESLSFSRAYSHAPWTTPSHVSMLTGLYPVEHGHDMPYMEMLDDDGATQSVPQDPTLPDRLAGLGYETVAFVGHGPIAARYGSGRGFERYVETRKNRLNTDLPETLDAVTRWLDEGGSAPFFLFVHTFDLHDPRPRGMARDGDAIAYIDRSIGVLFSELKERGLFDSSLVIVTGDHGSKMIRTDGKCCVHGAGHYDENLRVPLLVRLPGGEVRGRPEAIARHVDLLPTVVDVLGVELADYHGTGVSLLDVASGDVTIEFSFSMADARCAMRYAIVSPRYKYIFTPRNALQRKRVEDPSFRDRYCLVCKEAPNREELFDLEADPFEERDLLLGSLSVEQQQAVERMRDALEQHLALAPRFVRQSATPAPDPQLRDSLKKLGYLE